MLERLHCCLRRNRQSLVRGMSTLLAAAALGYSALAPALGLGDLTLRSYLNQPFKADIELTDIGSLEPDEVSVTLASADDYARAGIDRLFFLNDLRFTPDFSGSRKVIHVTSSHAVTEPYLSFLVEVSRPGGQLLRAFTVLLDPPGTVVLPTAPVSPSVPTLARATARPAAATETSTPKPPATQNKRYVVGRGETLWSIGRTLGAAGTPTPTTQLVREIHALNPSNAPLKAGDSLLLPDTAVLPGQTAVAAAPAPILKPAVPPASTVPGAIDAGAVEAQSRAEAELNEQLKKNLEELQNKVNDLQGEVSGKDKEVAQLQTQLSSAPATPPVAGTPAPTLAPAATPAPKPAAPVAAPAVPVAPVVPTPVTDDDNSWMLMLGVIALLLLLIALLLVVRRNRQRSAVPLVLEPEFEEPGQAQANSASPSVSPVPVPSARSLPQQQPVSAAARRDSAPATDALDGASIYIAYGRYNEALGILREGLYKQPERIDLRLRMLEVLGQMADREGFEEEAQAALAAGISAERLQEVRAQYPKLAAPVVPAPAPEPAVAPVAAAAAVVAGPSLADELEPDFDLELPGEPLRKPSAAVPASEPVVEPTPAPGAEPEFDLDLGELSMSSEWDLVSPFEAPAAAPAPLEPLEVSFDLEPVEIDFTSSLKEHPDALDLPDEQFLSDFDDLDESLLEPEPQGVEGKSQAEIDKEFLDSFIGDADLPELDALTVDFDIDDNAEASAETLKQAREWIDRGDYERASQMLHQLLLDGDESSRFVARQLLASIE